MKKHLITIAILLPLLLAQCSSLYRYQRAKDSADIFTFAFQTQSYGAALRTGPVKLGLNYKSREGRSVGLRAGEFGEFDDQDFSLFLIGSDLLFDLKREKTDPAKESLREKLPSTLKLRRKDVQARSPFGTTVPLQKAQPVFKESKTKHRFAPVHHQTGIEISAGLYFGIRFGFNVGELFDWAIGWSGGDPFGDDLPFHPDELPEKMPESIPGTQGDDGVSSP
jgi:hypothetical protein